MNKIGKLAILAVILGGLAYGGARWILHARTLSDTSASAPPSPQLLRQGEYVARSADCFACHTAPGGKAYAGGLSMQTPLGAVYSTNITPDKETGIGTYSFAQFRTAVQHGVRADGSPLYPAMPYPSYAIMPAEDMRALYAYFMHAVAPVRQQNAASTLPPVLNMRWPLAYWQLLFASEREFVADARHNAQLNRGKYLVEGPGHCGACHTPRGLAYQEKALADDGRHFLAGAEIDGWRAKSLRGEAHGLASWSQQELAEFLRSGRTARSAAFGAMADVVEHSTRYWTEQDLDATAAYLKTLAGTPGKTTALPAKHDTTTQALLDGTDVSRGALLYKEYCMVCHRADGNGIPRIFPALNHNSAVYGVQPQSVIQITLEGGRMAHTEHDAMTFAMPAFNHLSDADIAEVVNFVRNGWNNQADAVRVSEVTRIRRFIEGKAPNIVPAASSGAQHE